MHVETLVNATCEQGPIFSEADETWGSFLWGNFTVNIARRSETKGN